MNQPRRRPAPRTAGLAAPLTTLMLVLLLVGCGTADRPSSSGGAIRTGSARPTLQASPSPTAPATAPSLVASPVSSVTPAPATSGAGASGDPTVRPSLPSGFPVMPGASLLALPADPSVIARWSVPILGSGPYDFYLGALPAAGYPIVGRYPTERAALIRFEPRPGLVWQLLIEAADGATRLTIQADRP